MTRINGDEPNPEGSLDEEGQSSLTESANLAEAELSSEAAVRRARMRRLSRLRTQMKGAECEAA